MKDELIDLLQQRFTGHEVEAPAGAWEAISGQIAVQAHGQSFQGKLQDKFTGHEMHVDPSVWQGISSQLGHGVAASGAAGISGGWLASGVAVLVVAGGLIYWGASGPSSTAVAEHPITPTEIVPAPAPAAVVPATPVAAAPASAGFSITPAKVPTSRVVKTGERVRSGQAASPRTERSSPDASTTTSNTASSVPSGTPSGTSPEPHEGSAVVNSVLQQLVTANTTKPEPEHSEPVPPATAKDMPGENVQPTAGTDAQEPSAEPKQAEEPNIFIPNVFSPNNDGTNDLLEVKGGPFKQVQVRIISAKDGTVVFKANDLEHSWNGELPNQQIAEDGYYLYAIEAVAEDGRTITKGGTVRLFR